MFDPTAFDWRREGGNHWRDYWGLWLRFLTWFENLFGWAASLLFVAVLSGLAKKDDA
jgi:hypothetical protein